MSIANANHYFLRGGGEMGELIRAKDWGQTALGDPAQWPQSLRTMVAVMLENPFGMYIAWGNDYTQLYNDGYRPILGTTKHPQALGNSTRKTFEEIWHIIGPMFDGVMKGIPVGFPDLMLPLNRNGYVEECYFDFSYSPIRKDDGEVGGVLVTVMETTNKRKTEEDLKVSEARFRDSVMQAPVGITILRGKDYVVEMANDTYLQLVDKKETAFVGRPLFETLPEVKESVNALLDSVLHTGVPFHGNEVPVPVNRYGKQELFYFDFLYHPLKERDGSISGIIATVTEVTEKVTARKKVEQNGKLLESIFFNAPAAIAVITEPEHVYVLANNEYQKMVNRRSELLVGKASKDIFPELVGTGTFEIFDRIYQSAEPFSIAEYPVKLDRNNNGILEQAYFRFSAVPLKDAEGKFDSIVIVAVDITAQVVARQKVEASEKKFEAAILAIEGNIWTNNANGEMIGEQPGWAKLTGQRLEEYEGYGWAKAVHPDDAQPTVDAWNDAVKHKKIFEFEHRVMTKENGWRLFSIKAVPSFDEDGIIQQWVGVHTDITEQREAVQKIKESEKRFRLLADSMPQHIWTSDTEGNLNYYNQSVLDYSGLTLEQINKDGWMQIVHPDDREANVKEWINAVTTGNNFLFEHRFRRYDGEYRWQLSRAIPQKDENGKIQMWVGTSTDIEEQKTFTNELERQVRNRTKELADTNIELEKMNKELQSFAYISSHDLQEPLRKIQTFSSQIMAKEAQNLSDAGKDKFFKMQTAAQRMQTLINDLLAYSRSTTEERKFEKTHLSKIIDEVREDLKEDLKDKQAIFEAHSLCEVNIIPFQFRQLMLNLVSNALKFSTPAQPPHIIIKCETATGTAFNNAKLSPQKRYCHISVSDNGIGFEQAYSEKIFEVFQRLHGQNEYKGTGIGLSIVKKIVENHEGIITANSELNKGTTFDIYIPAIL